MPSMDEQVPFHKATRLSPADIATVEATVHRRVFQLFVRCGRLDPKEAKERLFTLAETLTLYDLTNTFFEGVASANEKAQRGHSKEKRMIAFINVLFCSVLVRYLPEARHGAGSSGLVSFTKGQR